MKQHQFKLMVLVAAFCFGAAGAQAAEVADVLKAGKEKLAVAKSSQKRIDKIAEDTLNIAEEFNTVNDDIEDYKLYNEQQELIVAHQQVQMDRLRASIAGIQDTERQIPPLISRMIDALEHHIAIDLPYNLEERQNRVKHLREILGFSDMLVSEKFRQVLQAYGFELENGFKLDTYVDQIEIDGALQEVNILRLGRIALVYQTKDKSQAGVWDRDTGGWVALDASEYRNAISAAIRIAKKTATIDILTLPIKAPEVQ